ncbi:MAG: ThiF family adenylyltransferase [Actinomycetota bacterium]|nr:ThiF family adenylyltransferase [Actinomycetota bacterium]
MKGHSTSVAMTAAIAEILRAHVDRPDGQEDISLATYRPSTGATRSTALITSVITPEPGERHVHGNASIEGDYVLRAARIAYEQGEGLALCHSHPGGRGWQSMSGPDFDAEHSFANLVRELTGHPLVGITFAGRDGSWSARHWDHGTGPEVSPTKCDNVRVVGETLEVTWNEEFVPSIGAVRTQRRSVSCWGADIHSNLVRRKVLVVGAGSVGLDVALRLAATGLVNIGVMDFDTVEPANLDRLIGATPADAALGRAKLDVVERLMHSSSTADKPTFTFHDTSICDPNGLAIALDYDVIVCCVDRPWARIVLNQIAYADLVPVIDGGISIDVFDDGKGMRNATWRSHVLRPGRPCLVCNEQVDISEVALDIQGLLDDPSYIAGAGGQRGEGQNVALLSISAAASLLAQFVSFNVGPGGIGDPGPLQYLLSTHTLEHLAHVTRPGCPYESAATVGDGRQVLTGHHTEAEALRTARSARPPRRLDSWLDRSVIWLRVRIDQRMRRRLQGDR